MRPKRERNRREVINNRDGVAIFCEVDRSKIKLAGIAGFDTDVRELLRYIHRQLVLCFFAARRAENPSEFPFLRTKRTEQKSFPAVAFRPQHAQKRPRPAQRANSRRHNNGSPPHLCGAKLRIGLKECARNELGERANLLIVDTRMLPVSFQARNPGIRRQQGHLMRSFPQRRRSMLFDRGKKAPKVGKKHSEVKWISRLRRGRAARSHSARSCDVCAKRFLKRRDVLVEVEKFAGKGVFRRKALGAAYSRVVF